MNLSTAKTKAHRQGRGPGARGVRAFQFELLLLVVCIVLTVVQPVLAASTGAKVPTNIVSTGSWSNFTVARLNASDDSRASSGLNQTYGVVDTFDFGVAAGAQIDGIKVEIEGRTSWLTVNYDIQLSGNSGTSWTDAKPDSFTSTTDATDTLGGPTDDWGWSWGDTGFSNANFQLRIHRIDGFFSSLEVDLIRVTVYYSESAFAQTNFRGRNDDGSESAATWKAAADTNWTQKVDDNFRVRFVVQETAGASAADKTFQLEYNRNGGGWNDVDGSSSVVRSSGSGYVGDGADTTQQVGSGIPVDSNNDAFSSADGLAGSANLDFSGSDEVEVAYCVQIRSADVANGDTIQLRVKGLDAYSSTPTVTVSGIPEFDQDAFRGRNDDGSESVATWQADTNSNWTQVIDKNFRVRFVIQETGDGASDDRAFQLEYNHNGGGWNDVTGASSAVRAWTSPNVVDGADTTQQIGSGTPVDSNNDAFDEVNGLVGSTNLDFSGSDEVEVEYCVQIRSAVVSATDTIQLRVKGLDNYTNTPTITASASTPPVYDQDAFRARNDNGNETAATWKAAANTNWTQKVDENFRLRFVVQETAGISDNDKTFQLEYNFNGGGWNDVNGSSSVVRATDSTYLSDGADTTQQIGSGTPVGSNNDAFDDVSGLAGSTNLDFSGSDEVELEFCVQIRSADVSNDDTIELRVKGLNTYTNMTTVTVTGILELVQDSFRGRNNDGNETTATWRATKNVNWTQPVEAEEGGEHFRVRLLVREHGGVSTTDRTFQLEYNLNGGGWNDVTGSSSYIQAHATSYLTDGEDTTQQLGSGTYVSDNDGVDETNGQAGGAVLDFAGGDEVELEFSLRLVGEDVVNNDTIQLRIKGLDTYSNTPTIMVQDCTFHRYRTISIHSSQIGADLTDFPVMIMLTGTEFQSVEDDVTDSDGDDIIFRESLGGGQLSHEIELYDANQDILVAWVKLPSVSSTTDTDIYMYYGNGCITSSTEDAAGVWSNGYEAVYHLHDDYVNSEGTSGRDGSGTTGGYVAGQIANGVDFEADSSDYIDIGTWSVSGDKLTLQAWVKYESLADLQTILDKSNGTDASNYAWNLSTNRYILWYRARMYMPDEALNGSTTFSTGTWYFLVGKYDGSNKYIRLNNAAETSSAQSGNLPVNSWQVRIGDHATGSDQPFDGVIDEVRVSSVARSNEWLNTEYNNMSDPGGFISVGPEMAATTAVDLIYFAAQGDGNAVSVKWQTAREYENVGFHLYRASSPSGPFERLTDKLISATVKPGKGGYYSYVDNQVTVGSLYYYKLEDIDIYGKHTAHGPVCVDWDADLMPDDWEITHGLNPWVDDRDFDYDADGLSNFEEYERGLDPFNADSDGDGIPDGEEDGRLPGREDPGSRSVSRGVEVLGKDASGMTVVLNTGGFEAEVVTVDAQEYEQLSIADYVHGYTSQLGAPRLPLKGILIDVPAGKTAQLSVVDSQVESYRGYRVYPVPKAVLDAANGMAAVGSAFVHDDLAYNSNGFYPDAAAQLGQIYVFGDQLKQQVIFYPIGFNPATGQLQLYRRIELRIDFVKDLYAKARPKSPSAWQVPGSPPGVLAPIAVGLAAAPALVNPISPLLSSLGAAIGALWSPPQEADGNVYKIITDTEGIYQISKDYLDTNGVDTAAINLSQLRLYYLGQEVAIEVFDQNSDDRFDAEDYIRFYARPVNALYAKYSDQNVYWLTLSGGSGSPLRMANIEAAPAGGALAADFADSAHHELNQVIWIRAPGEDRIERWFFWTYVQGDQHAGGGQPVAFSITVPDPTSSGTLTILMAGQTDTEHEVTVAVNGVEQSFSWAGISYFEATLDNVPLNDGENAVTLQCLSADGNDSIIVDWFKIDYWRDYVAVGNTLKFSPDSGDRYAIDGFSSNSLLAYDISNPAKVAKIKDALIAGADPYSFEFEPTIYGDSYLVLAADTLHIPVGLIQDTAANLADTANGADYILITHRDVGWDGTGEQRPWLSELIAHRESQGLRVFVADIEDIYDTFSFGIKSPQAVKDFLAYAYAKWTPPAPRYVLLVGDGTYDPKNHWNESDTTAYLPTYMIYTDFKGETVTDQWFVTFSGDDAVDDMHIGRLPAADAAQAQVMVNKIIAYESAINTQTWQNDLLLIADNQRPGAQYRYEADFETMNEHVAALIPSAMTDPFRGYLNDYAATAFLTDDIIDSINDGVLMVNYAGHGGTQILAHEHIFEASDVPALTNSDRLPFFVSMACEAGFFAYPETWAFPSLAEALLRSDAGAMAAFMPTGMTSTEGQQILDAALFEAIFTKDIRALGPAIADAKQTLLANGDTYFEQISDTFLLFGDPATALQIPLPHVPGSVTAEKSEDGVIIRWDAVVDCNDNAVAGYNIYRASSAAGPFSKINIGLVTDSVFVDTEGVASMAAGGSSVNGYYTVSAVDNSGFESVQSLAVKPASTASASAPTATEVASCFISTAIKPAKQLSWMLWLLLTIIAVLWGRHTVQGKRLGAERRASGQRQEARSQRQMDQKLI